MIKETEMFLFLYGKKVSISFFIIFGVFLFFEPFGVYTWYKHFYLEEDIYHFISEIITEPIIVSFFSFSISSFISLIMLIMLIISTALVGVLIIETYINLFASEDKELKEKEKYYCIYKYMHIDKIYILNCRWRN